MWSIFAGMARIALNARLLIPGRLEGIGWFTHALYQRIVTAHPEHDFLLLFDRAPGAEFQYGPNATCRRLLPPARRPFLVDAWMDLAVPQALRRWQADAFISSDGFLSRRTRVPQLAVMHDLNFEHHPEWLPERDARHYRTRFREFSAIAARLATVSRYSQQDIHALYGVPLDRIDVVPNAPSGDFRPLTNAEQQNARNRWNAGNPYHCFVGSLHPRKNIPGLLRAHAAYRAAGGTADLLVVGAPMWGELPKDWQREAGVRWLGRLGSDALEEVVAGSNALVYLPHFEGFGIPLVEAMAAGVPVVASDATSLPEVLGGAAAGLVDADDAEGAAQILRRLETDSAFYANRSAAGLQRAQDFSWDRSAKRFWESIERVLP
jgi:glycosyltransferase involved in cell wall biosynthesis